MNVAIWYIYLDVRTEMTLSPPVSPSYVSVTNIIIPPNMHISRNQMLGESSRNSITYMGNTATAFFQGEVSPKIFLTFNWGGLITTYWVIIIHDPLSLGNTDTKGTEKYVP
jgi:hypothetical protein